MTSSPLDARLALARLEAGLVQNGLSTHSRVMVPLLDGDDPTTLLDAVQALCEADPESEVDPSRTELRAKVERKPNGAQLERLYISNAQFTHVTVPAELINVPPAVDAVFAEILARLESNYPEGDSTFKNAIGWTLGIHDPADAASGITLRIATTLALKRNPRMETYPGRLTAALGVPVRCELGMQPDAQANPWAHVSHNAFGPGMSVGSGVSGESLLGGTIALPVRKVLVPGKKKPERQNGFLTAGHILPLSVSGSVVRQPAENENLDRQIGKLDKIDYVHEFDAVNFFDIALIEATKFTPTYQFSRGNKLSVSGVFLELPRPTDQVYIYGASSSLRMVKIESLITHTSMLSLHGVRTTFRDMIEFKLDGDDTKPVTIAGDSGAPLLVRQGDQYLVAGVVIGGGSKPGSIRKPRSFAVPIKRILEHFKVEAW